MTASAALDTFMSSLMSNSSGCSCAMTIISDNAKVQQPSSKRGRNIPERSRSMPLNRWAVDSHMRDAQPYEPTSPVLDSHDEQRLSRWESLTGTSDRTELRSQSLTLPKRREEAFKNMEIKTLSTESRRHNNEQLTNKHLPNSLRNLPY